MEKYVMFGFISTLVLCCFTVMLAADDRTEYILALTGAAAIEDLEEDMVEKLDELLRRPLNLNDADMSELLSAGLMSVYQAASLEDYRSRHGNVMSVAELATVDGFGRERADALAPFVSFGAENPLSVHRGNARRSARKKVENDLTVRSAVRLPILSRERTTSVSKNSSQGFSDYSYGVKYRISAGRSTEAGLAINKTYSDKSAIPSAGSFFVMLKPKSISGKIVAGDYHLRYGQGLVLWTGFSMSGFAAPESFIRRPNGISPCCSYSGNGSLRGVAADFRMGKFMLSGSVALNGLRDLMAGVENVSLSFLPALNVSYFARSAQVSFTCFARSSDIEVVRGGGIGEGRSRSRVIDELKCAADVRWCVRGVELYAEGALDALRPAPAFLAGACAPLGDAASASLSLRYYPSAYRSDYSGAVRAGSRPSGEHGIAAAFSFAAGKYIDLKNKYGLGVSVKKHTGTISLDATRLESKQTVGGKPTFFQLKMLFSYKLQIIPSVCTAIRITERLRSRGEKTRTDIRCDAAYSSGNWMASARMHMLHCRKTGLLSYAEGGCLHPKYSVYLRTGIFRIDDWEDRIYVYERDAPGNFTVPAYYGRGIWCAAVSGIRLTKWMRINLRASMTIYPLRWQSSGTKKRQSTAEFKLQLSFFR